MIHRILPFFILIALLVIAAFNYGPTKRELAYKFGFSGDPTSSCCNEYETLNSNGNFDESASTAIFEDQIIDYPKTSLAYDAQNINDTQVLGTTTNSNGEEKWIDVSLTEQRLRAYEGNKVVMEFPISSGKWYKTPTGTWNIWYKTRSQRMKGGSKELGTFYDLPNVPSNMFFYKGYALHGAYWHNNFGHPMSHGCVNEPLANAKEIFEWAGPVVPAGQNFVKSTPENPGTRVVVHK
jgi:lipoprotein-anchoring transpeptidase ErfK/SrfK